MFEEICIYIICPLFLHILQENTLYFHLFIKHLVCKCVIKLFLFKTYQLWPYKYFAYDYLYLLFSSASRCGNEHHWKNEQ